MTSWAILLQFCILSFAQAEIFKTIPADEIPKVGFPPDTLVWTYNSSGQPHLSSIKDCVQGQEVASVNIETGRIEPATIVGALVRTSSLVEIDLEQNCDGATQSYTMCLCAEHKILSPTLEKFKIVHAWREAQDLQSNHLVLTYNPTTQSRLRLARVVAVRKPEKCNTSSPVVCSSLDKNHNFLVGPSGLVAHNFCFPFPFTIGITISLEGTRLVITGFTLAIGTALGWLGTYIERNKNNNKPKVTAYYSPDQPRAATGGPDPDDDEEKKKKRESAEKVSSNSQQTENSSNNANNPNAQKALNKKLRALESAQKDAVEIRKLPDGRIRYYAKERLAAKEGSTRSSSYVIEYNPSTNQARSWIECYDHKGNVNRVHPKTIDGQDLIAQHYPLTQKELSAITKNLTPKAP